MYEKHAALKRMQYAIWEWLVLHELENDTSFWTISEWLHKDEDYHNEAEIVLTFEGSLHTLLNFGGDTSVFQDLVESFGFYYELGHSWNMGFYSLDNYDYVLRNISYASKLEDARWKNKSMVVKQRAENKCEDCRSAKNLEAHHSYYQQRFLEFEPWEYPLDSFRCLCNSCHKERHKEEIRIRAHLSSYSTETLNKLRASLSSSSYWLDGIDNVTELLESVKNSKESFISSIESIVFFDK